MYGTNLINPEDLQYIEADKATSRVLLALAAATDYSLSAHVSKHAILAKFRRDERGSLKKHLKRIEKHGLACKHPTHGETTWQLTVSGLKLSIWLHELDTKNDSGNRVREEISHET